MHLDGYRRQIAETNIDRQPGRKVRDEATNDEYCLWEKLGEGAFGAVYRAKITGQYPLLSTFHRFIPHDIL